MSSPGEHRALGVGEELRGVVLTQRPHLPRTPEFCLPPGQTGAGDTTPGDCLSAASQVSTLRPARRAPCPSSRAEARPGPHLGPA